MLKIKSDSSFNTYNVVQIACVGLAMPADLVSRISGEIDSQILFTNYESLADLYHKQPVTPQIVVIFQDHPDQYVPDDANELPAAFPLSRIIVTLSPYCAAEGRTRKQWPLAWRVHQDQLLTRLQLEISVIKGQTPAIPVTANDEEVASFLLSSHFLSSSSSVFRNSETAILFSPDAVWAETLSDLIISLSPECSVIRCITLSEAGNALELNHTALFVCDLDPQTEELKLWCRQITPLLQSRTAIATSSSLRVQNLQSIRDFHFDDIVHKLTLSLN